MQLRTKYERLVRQKRNEHLTLLTSIGPLIFSVTLNVAEITIRFGIPFSTAISSKMIVALAFVWQAANRSMCHNLGVEPKLLTRSINGKMDQMRRKFRLVNMATAHESLRTSLAKLLK